MTLKVVVQEGLKGSREINGIPKNLWCPHCILKNLTFLSPHTIQIKVKQAYCHSTNPLSEFSNPLYAMVIMSQIVNKPEEDKDQALASRADGNKCKQERALVFLDLLFQNQRDYNRS